VDTDDSLCCISNFTFNQHNAISHLKLQYELKVTVTAPKPGRSFETLTFIESSPTLNILPHLSHSRHVTVELNVGFYGLGDSKVTVDALKGLMWFRTFKHILDGVRCLEDFQVTAVYNFEDIGYQDWLENDGD
jgi:hypothetical protein